MKKIRMLASMWPMKLAKGGWRTVGRSKAFAKEVGTETWEDVSTDYSKCRVCGYVRIGARCEYCKGPTTPVARLRAVRKG